jgi:hypothetical protein
MAERADELRLAHITEIRSTTSIRTNVPSKDAEPVNVAQWPAWSYVQHKSEANNNNSEDLQA